MIKKVGVIGVPYNVGWTGPGVADAARALRDAGLIEELKKFVEEVTDLGDIEVNLPPRDDSDPKLLNPGQVEAVCRALATKVHDALNAGYFPLIIGGEDGVLMGIIEGILRALGPEVGLVYLDAHGDFNTPQTTPSGLIGGMNVAITAGRGSKELVEMFGHSPLLPPANIALYGTRDLDTKEAGAVAEAGVEMYPAERIHQAGAQSVVRELLDGLGARCDHMYVHVDLDVLDEKEMSAQCLPVGDGFSMDEFRATVRGIAGSGKLRGMGVMVFNAAKDPKGSEAKKVAGLIAEALAT